MDLSKTLLIGVVLLLGSFLWGCERIQRLTEFEVTDEVAFILDPKNTENKSNWEVASFTFKSKYLDKLDFHDLEEDQVKDIRAKSFEIVIKNNDDIGFLDSCVIRMISPGMSDLTIATLAPVPDSDELVFNVDEVADLEPYFKADEIQYVMEGYSKDQVVKDSINMRMFFTSTVDHNGF